MGLYDKNWPDDAYKYLEAIIQRAILQDYWYSVLDYVLNQREVFY